MKFYPLDNAHLVVVKVLDSMQEIELNIQMKIFAQNMLKSITIMKVLIDISQYDSHR